jgi:DNA-binding PucR family transcriptional regulator
MSGSGPRSSPQGTGERRARPRRNCNGNYRETARLLDMHHNTVRYRISQIIEMTGGKALQPRLRLDYHLALKLLPLVS